MTKMLPGVGNMNSLGDTDPILSLGSAWMNTQHTSSPPTMSPGPVLSLGSCLSQNTSPDKKRAANAEVAATLIEYCHDLEESKQKWLQHKKEASWRLSRLEQQLKSEKAKKIKEKSEEIEVKIRVLREEEMSFLERIEHEYKEQLKDLQRDAEIKEAKLVEAWCSKHAKLVKLLGQLGSPSSSSSPPFLN